ncbi:MAG: Hpt domain-containing protein [Actinomycetota bacterium]|nr:Hpt domain-containing protein [Actinomycetota bacterium]
MQRAAHTLKSTAASFGAEGLSGLCRELERRARSGDFAGATDLLDAIDTEYRQVEVQLGELPDG